MRLIITTIIVMMKPRTDTTGFSWDLVVLFVLWH